MKKIKNELIKYAAFIPLVQGWLNKRQQNHDLQIWEQMKERRLPLPHILKQKILKGYVKDYDLKIFVETGTYLGEMVEAMKNNFDTIYSIELSEKFARKAQRYFKAEKNIKIIQGDSGREIEKIMQEIDRPALFWLDGHYSAGDTARGEKDTPVLEELLHILTAEDMRHVILIDDARAFGRLATYPTVEALKGFIFSKRSNVKVEVQDDIIRILPV